MAVINWRFMSALRPKLMAKRSSITCSSPLASPLATKRETSRWEHGFFFFNRLGKARPTLN